MPKQVFQDVEWYPGYEFKAKPKSVYVPVASRPEHMGEATYDNPPAGTTITGMLGEHDTDGKAAILTQAVAKDVYGVDWYWEEVLQVWYVPSYEDAWGRF